MPHASPPVYITWSILSCLLSAFLVFHLWNYDRFKCLKWNHGPYSGAFKRIMTYTYIVTIPCVMVYAIGFAIIKYKVGYSIVPGLGIIPTPYLIWPEKYRKAIFPFQLIFSIGWGLEMVTHLEELCFWLFLVNAGSVQQDWFRSLYFKTWVIGSVAAVIYMPIVTIFTRSNPLKCEAFSFLAGSLGDLTLTLWFTPILWTFPKFLNSLRREGVDMNTIVRLTTFYELNSIRVLFRFLFTVPLLILGVDGVRPHQHINTSEFWVEALAIIAGMGCVISSGITLVIFFPRSVASEIAAKDASRGNKYSLQQLNTYRTTQMTDGFETITAPGGKVATLTDYRESRDVSTMYHGDIESSSPTKSNPSDSEAHIIPPPQDTKKAEVEKVEVKPKTVMTFTPNRRADGGRTIEGGVTIMKLTKQNLAKHDVRTGSVNPFVQNFTSPIDLVDAPAPRPRHRHYY